MQYYKVNMKRYKTVYLSVYDAEAKDKLSRLTFIIRVDSYQRTNEQLSMLTN